MLQYVYFPYTESHGISVKTLFGYQLCEDPGYKRVNEIIILYHELVHCDNVIQL